MGVADPTPSKPPKHPDKVHSCSMASNSLPNSLSALLILVIGKVPCRLTRFQRELISWCYVVCGRRASHNVRSDGHVHLGVRGARHRVAGGRGWSSAQARNRRGCVSPAWDQLSSTLWCHPFLQLGRRLIRSLAPVHCTVTGSEADGVLLPCYRVSSSDLGWGR